MFSVYISENCRRQTFMFPCTCLPPVSGAAFDFMMPLRRTGVAEGVEGSKASKATQTLRSA